MGKSGRKVGHIVTKETREKLSEKFKGSHFSPKTQFKKGMTPYSKLHPEIMPRGKEHPNWQGGRRKVGDYWYILKPNHPFTTKQGYVCEHRLIVEKQIGRYLHRWEVCHHINKIKDDNRPENLMAFKKDGVHRKFEFGKKINLSDIIFDGRKS